MPIDPSIPLQAHGVGPLVNPMELMEQSQRLRLAREQSLAMAEQRRSMAAQREAETARVTQANADRAATGEAIQQGGGVRDQTLAWAREQAPNSVPALTEFFDKSDKSAAELKKLQNDLNTARLNHLGHMADGVLQNGGTPEALQAALALYSEQFPDEKQDVQAFAQKVQAMPPPQIAKYLEQQRAAAPYWQEQEAKKPVPQPFSLSPGQTHFDASGKPIAAVPEKVTKPPAAQEYEYAVSQGFKGTFEQYQNVDANRKRPVTNVMAGSGGEADIKEAVAGMKDGTIPPQLPGRASKNYTAMMAEAHRQGYDLSAAVTDWNATQKHIASMNGAQQLRLNQSVNALPELLDSVESLAKQWKGGRFPLLNSVTLKAAKGGAFGAQAASIAKKLDAQIADVTADLGNVYMGGNSPTDHALKLAEKSLSADWSEAVLIDMIGLARKNVTIRQNSIKNTGVAGASDQNPYAPPAPGAAQTGPQEGAEQPIPGIPGGVAKFTGGKWIRIK